MCFTPTISFTLFAIGMATATYTYMYQEKFTKYTYLILVFYSLMELLQTLQYSVVNDCSSRTNIFLTNVAYVFIIVQPLMWNTVFYLRNEGCEAKNIFKLAIVLCIIWVVWNIILRLMYNEKEHAKYAHCDALTDTKNTCTRRDPGKHLFWQWTSGYIPSVSANFFMYIALWFIPALLVPKERFLIISIMFGAFIAAVVTYLYGGRYVEFPSVWCYMSIFMAVVSFQRWTL